MSTKQSKKFKLSRELKRGERRQIAELLDISIESVNTFLRGDRTTPADKCSKVFQAAELVISLNDTKSKLLKQTLTQEVVS